MGKPKRLSVAELQWFAFVHAETDLEALVESYATCKDDKQRAIYEDRLQQIRAYRKKRWGDTRFEAETRDATSVGIYALMNARPRKFEP